MSTAQNTVAIVYDYDQTLSPRYMQDEVIFPAFGINKDGFWRRCSELVRDGGYDSELAYMKVLLDTLGMAPPTNTELKALGANLNFYNGLPQMLYAEDAIPFPDQQRSARYVAGCDEDMDPEICPISFPHMIHIGDGPTDVLCFTVMRKNGGEAIAVYNPDDPARAGFKKCYQLSAHADRVNHIAPAD